MSNSSTGTARSAESSGVRQPAKSKIRRHNNNNNNKRLSGVFNHSPNLHRSDSGSATAAAQDDPAELSCQLSVPGILKIFGSDICQGAHYKSVLATTQSSAKELLKEALGRSESHKDNIFNQMLRCEKEILSLNTLTGSRFGRFFKTHKILSSATAANLAKKE